MDLSRYELGQLLKEFPNIELSYEKNIHKKVSSSNIYLTIPKGAKYFAWFRSYKRHNVCFFLELDRQKRRIRNITIKTCCFHDLLCAGKGTILYGTIFTLNLSFFNIEDIFYLKGRNLCRYNQCRKFKLIGYLFRHYLRQVALSPVDLVFGIPIVEKHRDKLLEKIQDLPYNLYCIQHRLLYKRGSFLNERINVERNCEQTFEVRAEVHPDIYTLHYSVTNSLEPYKYACIPDYKTSVMMNGLFREIKENEDLDKLEESDDEEEFENIAADKFVDLERKIIMKCVYIPKFRSWKPMKVLEKGEICQKQAAILIEKNNTT